jgi:hypothetical protein
MWPWFTYCFPVSNQPAFGRRLKNKAPGSQPKAAFNSALSMPQLLGDCGTGRNNACCSILNNQKQKSWKFCLLKYGKDEK